MPGVVAAGFFAFVTKKSKITYTGVAVLGLSGGLMSRLGAAGISGLPAGEGGNHVIYIQGSV